MFFEGVTYELEVAFGVFNLNFLFFRHLLCGRLSLIDDQHQQQDERPHRAQQDCQEREKRLDKVVALFASAEPWTGGVVETDRSGRVVRFVEKPDRKEISTNLINAGIYVLEPAVLDAIPAGQFCDFGKNVFPALLAAGQPVFAMKPKAYIHDVGTPERLAQAQRDFENGLVMQ